MKIYFVLSSVNDPHANKRVKDFERFGHETRIYGFLRHSHLKFGDDTQVLGRFTDDVPYIKRLSLYVRSLRRLFKKENGKDIIWYYQGLDIAMFSVLFNRKRRFIYEECDLVHTYVSNPLLRAVFERIDKYVIRKSLKTVTTSEGFIQYHYPSPQKRPDNIVLIPNRLSRDILRLKSPEPHDADLGHLRFAYVGGMRFKALLNVADAISEKFPQHEFHFYGFFDPMFPEALRPHRPNVFYHGAFKSPVDLPDIYASVDVSICTYDYHVDNVRYAEPNKLYEAIYFRCPIVASKGTFLAEKIKSMGIGYECDPYAPEDIERMVLQVEKDYHEKLSTLASVERSVALDDESYVNDILDIHN